MYYAEWSSGVARLSSVMGYCTSATFRSEEWFIIQGFDPVVYGPRVVRLSDVRLHSTREKAIAYLIAEAQRERLFHANAAASAEKQLYELHAHATTKGPTP